MIQSYSFSRSSFLHKLFPTPNTFINISAKSNFDSRPFQLPLSSIYYLEIPDVSFPLCTTSSYFLLVYLNKILMNRGFLIDEQRVLDQWTSVVFKGLGKATDLLVVWSYEIFLTIEVDLYDRYQSGSIELAASFMVISSFFQYLLVLLRIFVEELQLRRVLNRFLSLFTFFLCYPSLLFASTTSPSLIFYFY